jgi:pteridine reductase
MGIQPHQGEPHVFALVTGAAHRLGKAIALRLAREGYAIGLHYHQSGPAAEETQREIQSLGVPVTLLRADLSQPAEIEGMFAEIRAAGLPLRIVVNSAGIMRPSSVRDISVEEWDQTLAVNLRAPLLCAQAGARLMEKSGGVIINITDVGARKTWSSYAAYSVSKAGLEALTRLLARALAPKIRVNAVAPGLILPSDGLRPQDWQRLVERTPLKQAGSPEDIAEAVLFLVRNGYITGETLVVDGGYQLV